MFAYSASPKLALKEFKRDFSNTLKVTAVIQTHEGDITVDLKFKDAPETVANFINLSQSNFYKGLNFHRVIQKFMIQGGDPNGNGTGNPGYVIKDEKNSLTHEIGAISMANAGPGTAGCQFFIVQWPQRHLNGKHTVFGKVIAGLDVIYRIEAGDAIKNIIITEETISK